MTLKKLVDLEYCEWKNRMMDETSGTYVLIYILLGFSILLNALWGFQEGTSGLVSFGVVVIYDGFVKFLFSVREKGIRVNILEKYIYTPIDMKLLVKAKMIVLVRCLAAPILLGQTASLLVCVLDPDKQGTSIFDSVHWVPLMVGCVYILLEYISCMQNTRKSLPR